MEAENREPELLNRRKLPIQKIIVSSVIVTVVCLAVSAWLIYGNSRRGAVALNKTVVSPKSTGNITTTPKTTLPNASVLVFQSNVGSSPTTTSLVGLDGVTKRAFTSDLSSITYDSAFFSQERTMLIEGDGLLASNKSATSFALLKPDGGNVKVSDGLTPLLVHLQKNDLALSSGIISSNMMYALDFSNCSSGKVGLVKINLVSGAVTTLLSAESTNTPGPDLNIIGGITPNTISHDGSTMYLLGNNTRINSVVASGKSLIGLDLSTGKFTAKSLPSGDYSGSAISKDSGLVTYQTFVIKNNYAVESNHIYNVSNSKDVVLPGEGLSSVRSSFSPDGAYLAVKGTHIGNSGKVGDSLQIFSTRDTTLVRQIELEGIPKGYSSEMSGIGWSGDHTFVYTTNSSRDGYFEPEQAAVHSIDAATAKIFNFPAGLGELEAVLNYHQ